MRIGFDAHVLDGRDQGTKTLLVRMLSEIAPAFPQHDFFVYGETTHPELNFGQKNLYFRKTPRKRAFDYLLRTMPRAARADSLDVMVLNYIVPPLLSHSAVMIHDVLPQTHPRFFSARFVARCWLFFAMSTLRARWIYTISDHSRHELRRIYPWLKNRRIDVLHLGPSFPDSAYTAELPAGVAQLGAERYVLCVGRIEPRKNMQMAVDAFRRSAPEDVRLVVVGRRETGVSLETGGDPRVIEAPGLSDKELAAAYRGADLFLYPSVAEGFGLPLLDAILFGLPVISSNRTSMAEIGGNCVTFFNPEEAGATEWLARRMAAHWAGDRVPSPTEAQRRERAQIYTWAVAARELVAGLGG